MTIETLKLTAQRASIRRLSNKQARAQRLPLVVGALGCLVIMLSGCATPEEQRQANLSEDQATCASMGAEYGSPEFTRCMLQQQERRDEEQLRFLKEAEINSKLARDAQIMRERREDREDRED